MNLSVLLSPYAVGVASRVAIQVLAFVQIMIASRYIDLSGFGTYTLGWACCSIVVSFVYTGFYQALLRSTSFDEDRHTGFWAILAIGGGGSAALAAIGLALGASAPALAGVFLSLAAIPVLRTIVAWAEVHLIRNRRVRLVSLYGMAGEAAALGTILAALEMGAGLYALVVGRFTALAVEMAVCLAATRVAPVPRLSRDAFARLRVTAFPLWGTSALAMFSNYGADLILGAFLNTTAVGAYRGGARISQTAADLVFQPLNTISWSRFSALDKAGEREGYRQVWLENMGFGAALLWPILVGFAMLASELVKFLFDDTWLPAAPIIVVLSLSRALAFLGQLLEPVMMCLDRGGVQLRVRAVGAGVLLASLLVFGRFGAEYAAWAHALTSCVTSALALWVLLPALGLRPAEAAGAFVPAALISLACAASLALTADLRAAMGATPGLLAAIAGLAVLWSLAVAWCLRRGLVALPRP